MRQISGQIHTAKLQSIKKASKNVSVSFLSFFTGPGDGRHGAEAEPAPSSAVQVTARRDSVCGHSGRTPQVPADGEELLPAQTSLNPPLPSSSAGGPGLCLLEVKQDP